MASGQRIPALCGPEAGRQLCRILVLLLRNQAVHRHVGILSFARNRREHLPASGLPLRFPRGALLQLRHQQRRYPDLLGKQPQQLRHTRRYIVLTPPEHDASRPDPTGPACRFAEKHIKRCHNKNPPLERGIRYKCAKRLESDIPINALRASFRPRRNPPPDGL